MKKILAILITALMVGAMATGTMAQSQNTDGTFGDSTSPGSSIGTLDTNGETYTKGITTTTFNVHFDVKGDNASRPKTKFSYTIQNGSAVAATASSPAIYAGVADGVKLPTSAVTDAWDQVNSTESTDTIGLTFDATKFSHAGIYRYILTETALTNEQTAIGISDGDTANTPSHTTNTLYLDVYVGEVNNNLAVTGAVLFDTIEQPTLSDTAVSGTNNLATYNHKIDGFYNSYTSYSLTIRKTVTGASGDTEKFFPFILGLLYTEPATNDDTNTTILGQNVTVTATNGSTVGTSYTMNTTSGTQVTYDDITIKNGGTVTITGLSKTAVVKLRENIEAGEGYNITSSVTGMGSSAGITSAVHNETDFTTVGTVNGSSNADITYTNNRASISPTGVALRFTPYIILAIAATFLLIIARRKKDNKDTGFAI